MILPCIPNVSKTFDIDRQCTAQGLPASRLRKLTATCLRIAEAALLAAAAIQKETVDNKLANLTRALTTERSRLARLRPANFCTINLGGSCGLQTEWAIHSYYTK